MATSLADINATLGVTNIALSGVVQEQKETNTGIQSFLKFLGKQEEDKVDDRRREVEKERETKTSISTRVGSAAGAIGGAAKTGVGFLGKAFGALGKLLPIGIIGTFISSIFASKLFKAGILGLGLAFGDQIAEMLTGEDAKKEVKDMVSGAIKGGAIGMLLGPKFGLLGVAIGALLKNEKVDKELGRLVDNLNELTDKFGGLSGIFKSITKGIGKGLEGINNLLEGKVDFESIKNGILLVGGVAALMMPGKIIGLLAAATSIMMRTPAGLALLAIAGGGLLANKLMGNNITEGEVDPTAFGTGALVTGAGLYGAKKGVDAIRGKSTASKVDNPEGKTKGVPRDKSKYERQMDVAMKNFRKYPRLLKFLKAVGRFGPLAALIGAGEIIEMVRTGNVTAEKLGGLLSGAIGGVVGTKIGAILGSIFPGPGTLLGGLVGGGLGYFAGDWTAKKLASFLLGGGAAASEMGTNPTKDYSDFATTSSNLGTRRPDAMDTPLGRPINMDPTGNVGGTAAIINNNSGNTNISNTNQAALFGNSSVVLDLGDQILVGGT